MKSIQALLFRLALYTAGIFILALGTVLFTCGRLGTSALVSVPFITADITGLTLGTATTLVFGVMVILQLFLQRKLTLKTLLQLPFSFVFGSIVDFYTLGLGLAQFQPESLLFRILILFLATAATATGAFFMLQGNFIMNAPDGVVALLSLQTGKTFGQMKLRFDLVMILTATLLGLLFLGRPEGIGIGTLFAALTVGRGIRLWETTFFKTAPTASGDCSATIATEEFDPEL